MKIAVCDDCHEDAMRLETFLEGQDIRLYFDPQRLLADVENRQMRFDLYLLDIFMDDSMGGIELAERIRARDEEAVICFVSTSDAFYRQAYDLYAVQYLLKPVQEADVRQLLERLVRRRGRERDQRLGYKWRGQAGFIPYSRILYIDSRQINNLSLYQFTALLPSTCRLLTNTAAPKQRYRLSRPRTFLARTMLRKVVSR